MYSIDSRTIQNRDIFIPVSGANFDGHQYIRDVLEKGAHQVIDMDLLKYAKYHRENKINATVIGITGSAGKTTVKDALYKVLSSQYKVHKTQENQNNEIGVPLTLLNAPLDADFIIIEMAMRARGEIELLAQTVQANYVIITSIGSSHIEFLKTKRNIALAKAEIFKFNKNTNQPHTCILNSQNPYASLITAIAKKNGFDVNHINEPNILDSNIELITELVKIFDIDKSTVRKILSAHSPKSAHRQNYIKIGSNTFIDDSYNANPESMSFAIQKLAIAFPQQKHGLILGEMKELGKQEKMKHQALINDVRRTLILIL